MANTSSLPSTTYDRLSSNKANFPSMVICCTFSKKSTNDKRKRENNPAPDTYDTTTAFRKLTAKSTPITLKSRVGGTQISTNQSTDKTPGPGAHDESKFLSNRRSSPKHSFGKRIPASFRQDPYVQVIP
ncbi:unnamed protein product [Rotaria socialis]|uniref:Uncharacterized protein n=1 Tax=Rotaria socialis TaxID=392032 RepID=A0A817SXZ7_9BILA|nr:unnamed protein product [Rotaria socialis]